MTSAINCSVPLYLLFPAFSGGRLNLREIPGITAQEYARNLMDLFDSGLIEMTSEFPDDITTTRSGLSRILDRFLALSPDVQPAPFGGTPPAIRNRPDLQVDFSLTPRGGEAWEKLAQPQWDRFLNGFSTDAEDDPNEMVGDWFSPDRDLLIAFMGWLPELNHEQIRLESITWETLSDHQVLYWKQLPFVYHACFRVRTSEDRWTHYSPPKWFQDWRICAQHWYQPPWELPGWPSEQRTNRE